MKLGEQKRVLVTGAAGAVGRVAVKGIRAAGHEVWGLDLQTCPHCDRDFVGDLQDAALCRRACDGVDVLVHLGAVPDDADFLTELMPANVAGLYQILTAAQQQGVGRMVIASSGQVTWHSQRTGPWPVPVTVPTTPRFWYAATKELGEISGRLFHREYGIDVISVRLGACPRDAEHAEELGGCEIFRDVYLSPRDAAAFFGRAVSIAPGFGFELVYMCSQPLVQARYDLEPIKRLLDYEPVDQWPDHLEEYWERPADSGVDQGSP